MLFLGISRHKAPTMLAFAQTIAMSLDFFNPFHVVLCPSSAPCCTEVGYHMKLVTCQQHFSLIISLPPALDACQCGNDFGGQTFYFSCFQASGISVEALINFAVTLSLGICPWAGISGKLICLFHVIVLSVSLLILAQTQQIQVKSTLQLILSKVLFLARQLFPSFTLMYSSMTVLFSCASRQALLQKWTASPFCTASPFPERLPRSLQLTSSHHHLTHNFWL